MPVGEASPSQAKDPVKPALQSSWLEPLWLTVASRRAVALPAEARVRMRPWVVAARARFRVARELRDLETQGVALSLLKEAAYFVLCALDSADPAREVEVRSPAAAWARFDALALRLPPAPEELALVRAVFGTDEALPVELVQPSRANELRLAAEVSVGWLLGVAEIRTPAELFRARLVRTALAALCVVVALCALVAYFSSLAALEPR